MLEISQDKAGDLTDAAGSLKDIYEQLVAIHDITENNRYSQRELLAKEMIIHVSLGKLLSEFKYELSRILPGIDELRKQWLSPEEYQRFKAKCLYDDERYICDRGI
ncbi:hypothetical protein DSCW_05370 [Desulfosarcina widdelii]|uniref:Uncharacterized protein n=1 Tax=Desulfosarcina widdelii TaxID=947919 RepID=A0A5K7YXP6_9BACT|nr:hypothetical protein [Desulfosarcina widdelii]BBO73120.1 hypothetical protein DSCW_05370 [Desulfosarcina widdelii]